MVKKMSIRIPLRLCVLVLLMPAIIHASNTQALRFQQNKGQISDQHMHARPDVLFSGNDAGLVFHLKAQGVSYQLNKYTNKSQTEDKLKSLPNFKRQAKQTNTSNVSIYRLDVEWLNCNAKAELVQGPAYADEDNYYLESCPNGALHVKSYASVLYKNLYPGIDLKWYSDKGHLKYDFMLAPGSDVRLIQLRWQGATSLKITEKGQLCIGTPQGEMLEEAPIAWQDGKLLQASWQLNGDIVGFSIQGIDSKKSCVIDPLVRLWATYYGGSGFDWVGTAYTDHVGNVFACGGSTSPNVNTIATSGAFQTTFGGGTIYGDSYLVKFNASGQRQWGTYFGGTGDDFANCCAVDVNGDIYISGGTSSTNTAVMTTPGCQQPNYTGGALNAQDAFLAKFNSQGQRLWSTYYGEVGYELTYAIAIDYQNDVYIVGMTGSTSNTYVASAGAHQTTNGGSYDGFLAKYNAAGTRLWSTFYGGSGDEYAIGCITDPSGNVYIGGISSSTNNIATAGAHQSVYGGGNSINMYGMGDAFLVKFNPAGVRQWGTYYGGTGDEYIYYLAADQFSNVYFSGNTSSATSSAIATNGAHQTSYGGGGSDAMVGKFNTNGQRQWASYYGGIGNEDFACCVLDVNAASFYFSGTTASVGGTIIASDCSYQSTFGGGTKDAFLAKFNLQGKRQWATYYGASGDEDWTGVALDYSGAVFLTGETSSSNATVMTSAAAHQTVYGGGTYDGFVVKFGACTPNNPVSFNAVGACKGQTFTVQASQTCGIRWFSDSTANTAISSGSTFTTNVLLHDTAFYFADVSCGIPSSVAVAHVTVATGPTISVQASPTAVCRGEKVLLTPSGAINYTWTNVGINYSVVVTPSALTVYTVTGTMFNGGCEGKGTVTVTVNDCVGINDQAIESVFVIKVYPNPSSGSITLSTETACYWRIYNDLGQEVTTAFFQDTPKNQVQVNLSTGVYLVQAYYNGKSVSQKVVVANG